LVDAKQCGNGTSALRHLATAGIFTVLTVVFFQRLAYCGHSGGSSGVTGVYLYRCVGEKSDSGQDGKNDN
jgi:hypothetical protein